MIHFLHRLVLHTLRLYEYLGWLRRQVLLLRGAVSPPPIADKRPRHMMLISQERRKLRPRELRLLLRSLPLLGISKVTVRLAGPADVQHALRGVAGEGELEGICPQGSLFLLRRPDLSIYLQVGDANTRVLRQSGKCPDPIDLLLSTQDVLQLAGVPALCIGFAELRYVFAASPPPLPADDPQIHSHIPSGDFITEPILRTALAEYASCQQNFGK